MAKTLVITQAEEASRVPFLRGILTRSLQDAGLSFDDSYRVASEVREELKDVAEISSEDLRAHVIRLLQPFGDEVVRRYQLRGPRPQRVLVHHPSGQEETFSRGKLRLEMARLGLEPNDAASLADDIHAHLRREAVQEINWDDLGRLVHRRLEETVGRDVAHRYLVWEEYRKSDRPLIVLLGGTAGTGKSTVAAQLAHHLEIVRSQSTDMLREVMRVMMPKRLLPVMHTSSFNAWTAVPTQDRDSADLDAHLVDGYLSQMELVAVACEAILARAGQERVSLILEGVHVHPALRGRVPTDGDPIVVQAMLGVLKPKKLRQRFKGRARGSPGRRAERYLNHFDAIWRLQSYLLSEADRAHVPIVPNEDLERAVQQLLHLVLDELSRHYEGRPEDVWA